MPSFFEFESVFRKSFPNTQQGPQFTVGIYDSERDEEQRTLSPRAGFETDLSLRRTSFCSVGFGSPTSFLKVDDLDDHEAVYGLPSQDLDVTNMLEAGAQVLDVANILDAGARVFGTPFI